MITSRGFQSGLFCRHGISRTVFPWLHHLLARCYPAQRVFRLPLLLALGQGIAGCDDFTRFRHETFSCNANPAGIAEVVINSASKGASVEVETATGPINLAITEVGDKLIKLAGQGVLMDLDRENGVIIMQRDQRFYRLVCTHSVFTM